MAELPNTPKLSVTIMMAIAFLAVFIVVIIMFTHYARRKRSAALMIAVSFTFWGIAALVTFIGTLLQYLHYGPNGVVNSYGSIQYSRYGINLGYAFSAGSNIFMFLFIAEIFSKFALFRRTQKVLPLINGILNGITVGLVINTFIVSFKTTDPTELYNPAYPIPQTVYHLALTLITFLILFSYGLKSKNQATLRWERAGFRFIMAAAISAIMVYVFFTLDLLVQDLWSAVFGNGYTIFNNIGWATAVLMAVLAFIGFFMPSWIRKQFKELEVT